MRAGKVAGVQLVLNNWFLVLMLLFALSGMGVKALGVFFAVLYHEWAHAAAALALGYRVREVELLPFGGVARIEGLTEAGTRNEIVIAAAGPLASLVLAAAIYICMQYTSRWADVLEFQLDSNLMLAWFNLIPGLPLDGGRMVRAMLATILGYSRATTVVAGLSTVISIGLSGWAVISYFSTGIVNLTFIIASIFLYMGGRIELKAANYRNMRILAGKKTELMARGVMPTAHFTAVENLAVRDVIRLFESERYYIVLVVDKKLHLQGILTETEVWEGLTEYGLYTSIGAFLKGQKL